MLLTELAIIFGRIITIIPLLLVMTLVMGKRSIGQVPIFDFLIIVTLASVTGADIADPSISHVHTGFAIVAIGFFQKIVAKLVIRVRPFGKWITFEPTVVVKDGKLLVGNVKSIRYSIDNVLQMLRQKNVFDINDVQLAIIEANGNISVLNKPGKNLPTIEDLDSYPIIIEGIIQHEVIKDLGLNIETLRNRIEDEGVIRFEDIFLCTINNKDELYFSFSRQDERIERVQH
ncbi:DUF421 domain-containing protein [Bacillus solitudinis]|uniref:DUF421 domain-containing protein n=1 Tax=Bacillus solitudinis TaxID=2014074 RepID=UPI000C240AF1|nr:DUF421 domain-containing protein [Bacillus solitudinis]